MTEEMMVFHAKSDSPHLYGIHLRGKNAVLWRLIFMTFFSKTIITFTKQAEELLFQQFNLNTL